VPYADLLETAELAARAGGEVVESFFRRAGLEVTGKGTNDFVTEADNASEAKIVEIILGRHPDHCILAEEGGELGTPGSSRRWFVDPLDGTTNFMEGLPVYGVSIACAEEGRLVAAAVLEPRHGNLFKASLGGGAFWNDKPMRISSRPGLRGAFMATGYPFRARAAIDLYLSVFKAVYLEAKALRRTGSAALDLAYTAAGVYEGFFEFRLAPWDIAAGALLIEEAGGVVTDLDGGDQYLASGNVLAGAPGVHADLLGKVSELVSEELLERVVPRDSL
jgi:myo-inositol-1(or 4)-monophosphatase